MLKRSNITWTDYSGGDANFVIRGRTAGTSWYVVRNTQRIANVKKLLNLTMLRR